MRKNLFKKSSCIKFQDCFYYFRSDFRSLEIKNPLWKTQETSPFFIFLCQCLIAVSQILKSKLQWRRFLEGTKLLRNSKFDLKDNFVNNYKKLECLQIYKFLRFTMICGSSYKKTGSFDFLYIIIKCNEIPFYIFLLHNTWGK